MGSDLQADYVGELRERAEKAEGALKVAAMHNHELQEENDQLKAQVAELRSAIETLAGCLPDQMFVYGSCGEKWSSCKPEEEHETVNFSALLASPNPGAELLAKAKRAEAALPVSGIAFCPNCSADHLFHFVNQATQHNERYARCSFCSKAYEEGCSGTSRDIEEGKIYCRILDEVTSRNIAEHSAIEQMKERLEELEELVRSQPCGCLAPVVVPGSVSFGFKCERCKALGL